MREARKIFKTLIDKAEREEDSFFSRGGVYYKIVKAVNQERCKEYDVKGNL